MTPNPAFFMLNRKLFSDRRAMELVLQLCWIVGETQLATSTESL